jgi:hypothetical protein
LTSHVHEEIQPVLHKEVIQPEVVHTTVPIHEVHHESAKHHGTSTLPAVSLSEFKQQGGVLEGGREKRDHFEGCAKGLHEDGCGHDQAGNAIGRSSTTTTGTTGHHTSHTGTGVGAAGVGAGHSAREADSRLPGNGHPTSSTTTGHSSTTTTGTHGLEQTQSHKPSLLDKLNPLKDADGDGKKGFMS